jgi:hypothetical protein
VASLSFLGNRPQRLAVGVFETCREGASDSTEWRQQGRGQAGAVVSVQRSARGGALLPDPDACGYEGQGSVDASGGDTNRSSSRREWWARLVPSDDGRFGQCKFRNDHVEWMIYIDMITRPIYRRYRAAWWCRAILRERDAVRLQDK